MNDHLWKQAHQLAAECAQRQMDVSLLRNAAAYLQENQEADFSDWLLRLVWSGRLFTMSDQTEQYRRDLWAACTRLSPPPENNRGWLELLHWAARLYGYYKARPQEARQRVNIDHVSSSQPPSRPAKWQVKKKAGDDLDIPEVGEPSAAANEFYAKFFGSPQKNK